MKSGKLMGITAMHNFSRYGYGYREDSYKDNIMLL